MYPTLNQFNIRKKLRELKVDGFPLETQGKTFKKEERTGGFPIKIQFKISKKYSNSETVFNLFLNCNIKGLHKKKIKESCQ